MTLQLRRVVLAVVVAVTFVLGVIVVSPDGALAATNLAKQPAIDVYVALGNEAGALKFFPDDL